MDRSTKLALLFGPCGIAFIGFLVLIGVSSAARQNQAADFPARVSKHPVPARVMPVAEEFSIQEQTAPVDLAPADVATGKAAAAETPGPQVAQVTPPGKIDVPETAPATTPAPAVADEPPPRYWPSPSAGGAAKTVNVGGYTRSNGTHVAPYQRSAPSRSGGGGRR